MCYTEANPIPNFDVLYVAPNLLDHSDAFMAQCLSSGKKDLIRAAKACVGYLNEHLIGLKGTRSLVRDDFPLGRASINLKSDTHFN